MSKNILIATLGEHPAVVTGMVKALREIDGIDVDILHVLHPTETGKYIGKDGFSLIADHLKESCQVLSEPLPFADPNDKEGSRQFLNTLANLLNRYQDETINHIYLSLAGGRKNMSALMALVTQFFPAIKGLYHLLDKREGSSKPTFPSIEYMVLYMSEEEVQATLDPPLENLNLVEIPCPGLISDAQKFWQLLQSGKPLDDYPPELKAWWHGKQSQQEVPLKLSISKQSFQDYAKLGDDLKKKFRGYIRNMQFPSHLEAKMHGASGWETDCEAYPEHKARSALRVFYYWNHSAHEITICRAMHHNEYDRKGEIWYKNHSETEPITSLEDKWILLVPLGTSPMIATQTYTLLQESEAEGKPKIARVVVLHTTDKQVKNGVRLLKKQFKEKGVEFESCEVDIKDVDSKKNCETYKNKLKSTIEKLRKDYPDHQIALSLSGGRKGMSALTLFAAQYTGIEHLYHTLINDPELEKQIEEEGRYDKLQGLRTDKERAEILFLDKYDKSKFEIFAIPIIPFSTQLYPVD